LVQDLGQNPKPLVASGGAHLSMRVSRGGEFYTDDNPKPYISIIISYIFSN